MSTVAEVLERYGVGISEEDLAELLSEALEAEGRAAATGLSRPEAEFLAEHSGLKMSARDVQNGRPPVVGRLATELGALARSVSTEELARRWELDGSRVRHRARDGALYSVRVGRSLRFPLWQFDEQFHPVPGLATVLRALPEGLHPAEVEGWMTSPNTNLVVDDEPVSARDWLLRGGGLPAVTELAQSIDRW
jgi:hypothetical protein